MTSRTDSDLSQLPHPQSGEQVGAEGTETSYQGYAGQRKGTWNQHHGKERL